MMLAWCLAAALAAHAPSAAPYEPGVDYFELVPRQKVSTPAGKIEIVYRHQYTVSLFRKLEPELKRWAATLPADVELVRKPHVHYPHARYQARMFLALKDLERLDLNDALYEWIWDKDRYPIYHNLYAPDGEAIDRLNLAFALAHGLERDRFLAAYAAPSMDRRVIDEEADSLWQADAMIIVDGRYATDIARTAHGDFKAMTGEPNLRRFFRLVDQLIARARADHSQGQVQ